MVTEAAGKLAGENIWPLPAWRRQLMAASRRIGYNTGSQPGWRLQPAWRKWRLKRLAGQLAGGSQRSWQPAFGSQLISKKMALPAGGGSSLRRGGCRQLAENGQPA